MTTSTNVYFWPSGVTSPLGRAIASLANPPLSYSEVKALNPPQLWTIWSVDVEHGVYGPKMVGSNVANAFNKVGNQYLGVKVATTSTLTVPAVTTSTIFEVMQKIPLITSEQGRLNSAYFVPNTLIGKISGIVTVTQSTGTAEVIVSQTPTVFDASIYVP